MSSDERTSQTGDQDPVDAGHLHLTASTQPTIGITGLDTFRAG